MMDRDDFYAGGKGGRIVDRLFGLKERGTTVRTEILAGMTTFLTMAYIVVVNPAILEQAGMDFGAVFVATVFASVIGTLIMGLFANTRSPSPPGWVERLFCLQRWAEGRSLRRPMGAVLVAGVIFSCFSVTPSEGIDPAIPEPEARDHGGHRAVHRLHRIEVGGTDRGR